jgi:hypothetical protein
MRSMARTSGASPLPPCIFIIWLATATLAPAQSLSPDASGQVGTERVVGFDQFFGPIPEIRTTFLSKPDVGADQAALKKQIVYSRILLDFVGKQLLRSPLRECTLVPTEFYEDASLQLRFISLGSAAPSLAKGLFGNAGPGTSFEPSLSHCTALLSELLQSAIIDKSTFFDLIRSNIEVMHRNDLLDFKNASSAARNAADEALRHIYLAGTGARLSLSSPEDYKSADFDAFDAWFARQKTSLRSMTASGSLPDRAILSAPSDEGTCLQIPHLGVEELNIDHHGWGHRAIIMIKNAYTYKPGWSTKIENPPLRDLCEPSSTNLGDRLRCQYRMVDRDRWLVVHGYGTHEPPTTVEMRRYARAIVNTLVESMCVDSGLKVLLVNFLEKR